MTSTMTQLAQKKPELLALAQRYGVRNIRVFGSVARGEDRPDSDIDLLVTLDADRDLFDLGGFQYTASELLGRYVDVVMEDGIRIPLQPFVMKDATAI